MMMGAVMMMMGDVVRTLMIVAVWMILMILTTKQ